MRTLHLRGKDAADFADRFFRPSKEELDRQNVLREQRNEQVRLSETEHGFSAEVDGLDLSFTEDPDR